MNILHSMDLTWVHGARSMRLMHTEWIPTLIEFRHCMSMVLDHVVATNLSVIQKNLWDPVKRKALVFNRPMEVGDATWQVLRELEVLLDQSQRRRYGGSWRAWETRKDQFCIIGCSCAHPWSALCSWHWVWGLSLRSTRNSECPWIFLHARDPNLS